MKRIAILGVCGYAGGELYRLLIDHPEVRGGGIGIVLIDKCVESPEPVVGYYPALAGLTDLEVLPDLPEDDYDLVFVATPDGVAMRIAPALVSRGAGIIDFAGDFRFRDLSIHEMHYGIEHTAPDLNAEAVYGLPERHRSEISGARIVGNPGCFPTAAILGIAPALSAGIIEPSRIIIDAKTGVSGAGRHPSLLLHFPERHENFTAYKVAEHKHEPEIEADLSLIEPDLDLTFVPHLIPASRGILETIYAPLSGGVSAGAAMEAYREAYAAEPFVRVIDEIPDLARVRGTNFCDISIRADDRTGMLIIFSALDNLVKGAAGQAIQNMNIILGFDETAGLMRPGTAI